MKRLKGTMLLELTDVNTSEVETVTEENMITNAVNNILGTNPMGIFYTATGEYDDAVLWNGTLLPICLWPMLPIMSIPQPTLQEAV